MKTRQERIEWVRELLLSSLITFVLCFILAWVFVIRFESFAKEEWIEPNLENEQKWIEYRGEEIKIERDTLELRQTDGQN